LVCGEVCEFFVFRNEISELHFSSFFMLLKFNLRGSHKYSLLMEVPIQFIAPLEQFPITGKNI
jgi:hypothetical protein